MTHDDYNELAYYTLSHPSPTFIHQFLVDAHAAQHADETTKPISLVFALVGLYLHVEKGYTGRQVQKAHTQLARSSKSWPRLPLAPQRGAIQIKNVLDAEPGPARDAMIDRWCASVWEAWKACRPEIMAITRKYLEIR